MCFFGTFLRKWTQNPSQIMKFHENVDFGMDSEVTFWEKYQENIFILKKNVSEEFCKVFELIVNTFQQERVLRHEYIVVREFFDFLPI